MIDMIGQMLSYEFMIRAIIVGVLVCLCASLLGVSLVLKNFSLIGDGLSHVAFATMAVAAVMNTAPLLIAIPVSTIAAYLLLRITDSSSIMGDTAIAMISTGALAIGVLVVSFSSGMNTDIYSYMFGSILAMDRIDTIVSVIISIIVLIMFIIFYNRIFAITFDESFAKATGVRTNYFNVMIALLTSVTIVLGMRIMGALLISSVVIFPAVTSMRVYRRFKTVTISAGIISVVAFLVGIIASYFSAAPTGASVVVVNIIFFFLFSLIATLRRKKS